MEGCFPYESGPTCQKWQGNLVAHLPVVYLRREVAVTADWAYVWGVAKGRERGCQWMPGRSGIQSGGSWDKMAQDGVGCRGGLRIDIACAVHPVQP